MSLKVLKKDAEYMSGLIAGVVDTNTGILLVLVNEDGTARTHSNIADEGILLVANSVTVATKERMVEDHIYGDTDNDSNRAYS